MFRRFLRCATAFAVVGGSAFAAETKDQTAGQLRSRSDEALISGKPDEALALLGKVIALEPLSEKNFYKRSRVYLRLKKLQKALLDLDAALRLAPAYELALAARAKLLGSLGRCQEAKTDWQLTSEVAKREKALKEAHEGFARAEACVAELNQGEAAKKQRNFRLYVELLGNVLEHYADASPSGLLLERARAYMELDDLYEAIADAGRALKSEPDNLEALELRGLGYYKLADHNMARTHWQEALKRDPEHAGCKSGYKIVRALTKAESKGDNFFAQGKHVEAVEQWRLAIKVDPQHTKFGLSTLLKIASALTKAGQYPAAVKACDEALRIDADSVDHLVARGDAQLGMELFDLALRSMRRAREVRDDDKTREAQQRAEVALKQSKEVNFYKVLEVQRTATQKEIKKAYRDAALKYHPDKLDSAANQDQKDKAVEKFQQIAQAYEILGDDEMRAKYDRGEDVIGGEQQRQQQHHGFPQGFHQQGGQRFHFQQGR